jgi:hypothetical protein
MIDHLIREHLPFELSTPLHMWRAQRYYTRHVRERYTARDKELVAFLERMAMPATALTGYKKSGNTWTRFVVANYFNLLANPSAQETLTFDELYRVQSNRHEVGPLTAPPAGFPLFVYSHEPYRKVFDHFDTLAYVYRHPLDTLISFYYFHTKREKPFPGEQLTEAQKKRLMDIDAFAMRYIVGWMLFHKRTVDRAHLVLKYEHMKADPVTQFTPLLQRMCGTVDQAVLERSIAYSSFESVKRKQQEVASPQGHTTSDLKVPFTRSGATRQFERELRPATVERLLRMLRRQGIDPEE